ncbi:hypothetical protein DL237_16945 [Pseudooceanicola sediminis]|uniref:Uncharacterized protein n=1 Tax=Pseudooceanicola sediminis TaxID=2211117 RepID=A0A399IZ63_9RHOB|nr:hypothetical protein [Pseudooceanicola sediminis]KAA2312560.1 hypothetical protein E0K93_17190 [Puniceibacterium sp. HSS470]RII37569.1 hypothetical protein DL237_16945 [Pseudooceanicola sediminis]|tara:strand:- start:17768 stop:17995 length:228 start_codon:yes stop_codon:yes gene_type:complete
MTKTMMDRTMMVGAAVTWSAFWVFCYWAAANAPMKERHEIVIAVLTGLGVLGAIFAYKLICAGIDWIGQAPDQGV